MEKNKEIRYSSAGAQGAIGKNFVANSVVPFDYLMYTESNYKVITRSGKEVTDIQRASENGFDLQASINDSVHSYFFTIDGKYKTAGNHDNDLFMIPIEKGNKSEPKTVPFDYSLMSNGYKVISAVTKHEVTSVKEYDVVEGVKYVGVVAGLLMVYTKDQLEMIEPSDDVEKMFVYSRKQERMPINIEVTYKGIVPVDVKLIK